MGSGTRRSWYFLGLLFAVAPLIGAVRGQNTSSAPHVQLAGGEKVPVANLFASGFVGSIKCDDRGSIYVRPLTGSTTTMREPVLAIASDGKTAKQFDLAVVPELQGSKGALIRDFALGAHHKIVELIEMQGAKGETSLAIASFDDDGKYSSFVAVVSESLTRFSPRQIASFGSGQYLISGVIYKQPLTEQSPKAGTTPPAAKAGLSMVAFTGIFDQNGKLYKELELPGETRKIETPPDADYGNPMSIPHAAIDLGQALSGEDGNVYLLRNSNPPIVYVVAPSGDIIRHFKVLPPSEGAEGGAMHLASGRLAFDFYERKSKTEPQMRWTVTIVDALTGESLWAYEQAPNMYGIPACYSGRDLTLLTMTEDRHMAIMKATPR